MVPQRHVLGARPAVPGAAVAGERSPLPLPLCPGLPPVGSRWASVLLGLVAALQISALKGCHCSYRAELLRHARLEAQLQYACTGRSAPSLPFACLQALRLIMHLGEPLPEARSALQACAF